MFYWLSIRGSRVSHIGASQRVRVVPVSAVRGLPVSGQKDREPS